MPNIRRVAVMLELEWAHKRHAETFAGVQNYARKVGWQTFIDEFVADTLITQSRKKLPYDGVIARATRDLALLPDRLRPPLVNVWRSSPVWKALPSVFPDFVKAGRLEAEHLLSRGMRHFAALMSEDDRAEDLELKGFAERLGESGFTFTVFKMPTQSGTLKNWRKIEWTIASFMSGWILPIGVIIGNERDGRMVAQMCHHRGWRVPEDVSIISGSNEVTYCEGSRPTLSSMDLNHERVGYEAAKLLDRLMSGMAPPSEHITIQPKGIVARESTDFFAVDDKLVTEALKFIVENAHKPIGQDDVARAVHAVTRTLQIRFRKFLGRPIVAEIRRTRIERAKRELVQGDRTIKEIARDVGFGEARRLCDVFQRELGVTPSQYRCDRLEGVK